jgi:hypothetical protein
MLWDKIVGGDGESFADQLVKDLREFSQTLNTKATNILNKN